MRTPALVDVETTLITHGHAPRTRFWGLSVLGEDYRRFATTGELLLYLRQRTDGLLIFHHHDFDAIQIIRDDPDPLQIQRVRGGRIITSGLGIHRLSNSYALFPAALAAILDATGHKKKPLSCEAHDALLAKAIIGGSADAAKKYDRTFDRCRDCQQALADRNFSDCEEGLDALLTLREQWTEGFGVDPFKHSTAAGVAMAAAKKVAGAMPVDLTHREAYRGGRTEAFRVGKVGAVDVFDVCSSYPASIAEASDKDTLMHVVMQIPDGTNIPPIFDAKRDDGLFFPKGRVETWGYESSLTKLPFPMRVIERYPVDLSWLHAIAPTVADWYEQKRTAPPALAFCLKINLNSLYGRFGLRPEREIVKYETLEPSGECTWYKLREGRYLVFRIVTPEKHKANYPLAAYVTDKARFRLYDGMQEVEAQGFVAYCDTDSIMGAGEPSNQGVGLGQWKREPSRTLKITSVKDYEYQHLSGCVCRECGGAVPKVKEKRKGGKRSLTWSLRRALGGKGALAVEKRRITPYGKRMVFEDGSTEAWDAEEY
jgi:hypothetical protein